MRRDSEQAVQRTRHELDVGAPPVSLGAQTTNDACLLEHLQVMGKQVAGDVQIAGQIAGGAVAESQRVHDEEANRVSKGCKRLSPVLDGSFSNH